jgi:peroxiredoxin (alkyl hydroperoxide reductase subunit C)
MKRLFVGLLLACVAAAPASAALKPGDAAPKFATDASLGGKVFKFDLAQALKKGPVVLYFYPAAFTPGCTIEAHEFADATDDFKKLGATVIGVSRDDIDKLNKFSVSECRSKFAVAADGDGKITQSYDVALKMPASMGGREVANRTSYVIAPDGKVIYEYTSLDPSKHVANTMDAVKGWDASHKR